MPEPITAALIAGGSSLLGSAINAGSTARQNKLNRKFAEHMYDKQRGDALADWAMQNEYNHPSSVMKRLREADLNPHLVYGNGANMPTAQIRPSSFSQPQTDAPQVDLGGAAGKGLAAFLQVQMQEQTIDNLRKQNTLLEQEAMLKEAQIHNVEADTMGKEYDISRKNFDLDLSMDTRTTAIEQQQASLEATKASIFTNLDRNQREWVLAANTVQEALVRMANIRAQTAKTNEEKRKVQEEIKNIEKDGELKDLDINLKKEGIQPGDPAWMRIIIQQIKRFNINPFTKDLPGHEKDGIIPMPWPSK